MSDKQNHSVGYGRPPKNHQFTPGRSGNPKGRRPKTRNASKLLAEELEKPIIVKVAGLEQRMTKKEALIAALVNDAINGKAHARVMLVKIMELENPAEPFVPTDEDNAALDAFISRRQQTVLPIDEESGDDE